MTKGQWLSGNIHSNMVYDNETAKFPSFPELRVLDVFAVSVNRISDSTSLVLKRLHGCRRVSASSSYDPGLRSLRAFQLESPGGDSPGSINLLPDVPPLPPVDQSTSQPSPSEGEESPLCTEGDRRQKKIQAT